MSEKVQPILPNRAPATKGDVQDLRRGLQSYIDVKMDAMEERIELKFDKVETRFDLLEEQIADIKKLLEANL